ncbi:MAG TPA: NADH-quinone oxidoreductase subunit C, partial [Burkholderiales bacterium]|nr:NADH-quinone oxidoreductase subunit C [Burkholderiales bacterium]
MATRIEALSARVKDALGARLTCLPAHVGQLTAVVPTGELVAVMEVLRDHPQLRFEMLVDLCGVDYAGYGGGNWEG